MINKKFTIFLFLLTTALHVHSQKQFVSSGGDITGNSGSVSFTLGQIFDSYLDNSTYSINEGVQQPFVNNLFPVTLGDFKTFLKSNTVLLDWCTYTEINSQKFIIQKSSDGVNFSTINETPAAGFSYSLKKYSSVDLFPFVGTNYYRLRQEDRDGKVSYSKIATVVYTMKNVATLYPNPTNGIFNLLLNNTSESLSYTILDENGKVLQKNNIQNQQTKIDVKNLPSAIYFLKIISQNKEIQTLQIIKTK